MSEEIPFYTTIFES